MEKFLVTGSSKDVTTKFRIKLPQAKHYEFTSVDHNQNNSDIKMEIKQAVSRSLYFFQNHVPYLRYQSLQHILSKHPFPRNQGPVILPIECEGEWEIRSPKDVMEQRTVFHHDVDQPCGVWDPIIIGIDAWKETQNPTYTVNILEIGNLIHGPSSLRDMRVVYTCNQFSCQVHCPCSICNDSRNNCRLKCKTEICPDCNSQCKNHILKLPRVFDAEFDHFTLITQKIGQVKIGIPHAGIPVSCTTCSKDALEHQSLHLVFHTRCKFCIHQMRAYQILSNGIVSMEDFNKANRILRWSDSRTCSYCLSKHQDSYARIKHEKQVHEGMERGFICKSCNKNFTNRNALDYHEKQHELTVMKEACDICGKRFSTKQTLKEHRELLHNEAVTGGSNFKCSFCEKTYQLKKSLDRHVRENHSIANMKKNLDYVQDLDTVAEIKCEYCEKSFKRNEYLKRHVKSVHAKNKSFACSMCDMKFVRKDKLNQHVKSVHIGKC